MLKKLVYPRIKDEGRARENKERDLDRFVKQRYYSPLLSDLQRGT